MPFYGIDSPCCIFMRTRVVALVDAGVRRKCRQQFAASGANPGPAVFTNINASAGALEPVARIAVEQLFHCCPDTGECGDPIGGAKR